MEQLATSAKSPELLRKELVRSFAEFELSFRERYPFWWLATLLAPLALTGALLGVVAAVYGFDEAYKYVTHALATFFVFGRFIILMGLEGDAAQKIQISLEPGKIFAMLTYMDFVVALFVTFHMGILFRLPIVGQKIAMLVWDGKFIMESQPWVKRMAFLGLVLFVMFPTSTTGSIGGSIFGRLLGMSRLTTVSGVFLGSVLGNGLMYAFAKTINQYINPENLWLKVAGVVILIAVVVLLEFRYQAVKKKFVNVELAEKGNEDHSSSHDPQAHESEREGTSASVSTTEVADSQAGKDPRG